MAQKADEEDIKVMPRNQTVGRGADGDGDECSSSRCGVGAADRPTRRDAADENERSRHRVACTY